MFWITKAFRAYGQPQTLTSVLTLNKYILCVCVNNNTNENYSKEDRFAQGGLIDAELLMDVILLVHFVHVIMDTQQDVT